MSVCEAVRELALAVDAAYGDDPEVRSIALALASMPSWLQHRRLDLWESHVQDAFAEADMATVPMSLLEAIFDFGTFNLYTKFDADGTARNLRSVIDLCAHHGLKVGVAQLVSIW